MIRFLMISTLLLLPSILGRTPFVSALKPYLKENLGFSDTLFSLAYSLGTLIASLMVPWVICLFGKNFYLKRSFQLTYMVFIFSLLGIFIVVKTPCLMWLKFVGLLGVYGGLRLCGQGLLPTLTKTYTASLFDDKICAWIGTFHTTVIVCFAGISLFLLAHWNAFECWNWVIFAQVIMLMGMFLCLPRNLPKITSLHIGSLKNFNFVLSEFPSVFKYGLGIIALQNLQATAVAFHLSDFAREQTIPLSTIYKVFLPISLGELLLNPIIAWVYNHFKSRYLFYIVILNLMLLNFSSLYLGDRMGLTGFILACALGWSCNHILSYSFPAYLLSKEQRTIGYATFTGWSSLCSALGPSVYSCLAYAFGSYQGSCQAMLYLNGSVFTYFFFFKKI